MGFLFCLGAQNILNLEADLTCPETTFQIGLPLSLVFEHKTGINLFL